MPRVKEHEDSITQMQEARQRIKAALRCDDFNEDYSIFENTWQARGCPDEKLVCMNPSHYDLYLDLKRMCDKYGLLWPFDGMYLLRLMIVGGNFDEIVPDDCPPRNYWQWFRMARTGLGLPHEDEIETAKKISDGGKRKRDLSHGLVNSEIAQRENVTERTVQNAIKRCWEYLDRGVYINRIADLAGLNDEGTYHLWVKIDLRRSRRGIPEE